MVAVKQVGVKKWELFSFKYWLSAKPKFSGLGFGYQKNVKACMLGITMNFWVPLLITYSSGRALPRKERIHFKNYSGYHYYLLDIWRGFKRSPNTIHQLEQTLSLIIYIPAFHFVPATHLPLTAYIYPLLTCLLMHQPYQPTSQRNTTRDQQGKVKSLFYTLPWKPTYLGN